ncbi:MAG TPA: serine/threonine-protein kinase, partial [Polyangiaceae bacterium]|nr:serine/threonine-protein kinase [Polyangiaceae bacterium]
MAASDAPVKAGTLLTDKYRVERVLGTGGMGVVVAARHLEIGELHAVKYVLPEARGLEEAGLRFLREARAAARLKSEHAVKVFDVGRFPSGEPYMVMEYLAGHDLKEELRQRGPLPVAQVADFVLQACEALAEAHAMGIIHRDLKPSNLFLTRANDGSPSIKVLDFGISKLIGALAEYDSDLTQTAALLGTPAYMSPEQMAEARDIDGRTDVWSLGIVLYELLSGAKPFVGRSIPAITMAVASQSVPSLRARRPDVPIGLETVVLRCLSKDRNARFPDVESFARALAPFAFAGGAALIDRIARVQRVSVPEVSPASGWRPSVEPATRVLAQPAIAPPAPTSYTAASWSGDAPAAGRRHLPAIVIAAVLTLVAVGAVAIWIAA